MTLTRQALLAAFLALAAPMAVAQIAQPACTAPAKPAKLQTIEEINAFARAVEAFQTCIMTFVEERQRVAKENTEAANVALTKWNEFVKVINEKK